MQNQNMKGLPHSLLWVWILLVLSGHGKSVHGYAGRKAAGWGRLMASRPGVAKPSHCTAAPMLTSPALLAVILLQTWLDCFWDLQEPACLHVLCQGRQRCQAGLAVICNYQQFLLLVHTLPRDGVQDKFQTTLQRCNWRDDRIKKQKHIPAPICLPRFYRPPWLSQAVLTSFTLPLWKMSMNRVLFRMVMNETQNQLTALLKSITGPCSLTRKDQAHLVQVVQSWCSVPTQRAFSL